ncbi:MAG: TetR/AcrR family transcriptional regulator [Patulibacter sp.]
MDRQELPQRRPPGGGPDRAGSQPSRPRRRSRESWIELALTALAADGLAAVAIEPLAKRGGATKGSLYWHFESREALLQATLDHWEQERTGALIDYAMRFTTPRQRLEKLLEAVFFPAAGEQIEPALAAASDDPLVAAALARTAGRRVGFLASQYEQLGFVPAEARVRAVSTYALFLGQAQLLRWARPLTTSAEDDADARAAHLADVVEMCLAQPPRG